jgi:hypothetical protein
MMMNNELPWPRLWWVLLVPALVAMSSCNPGAEKAAAAQTEEISSLERTKARLEHELKLLRADIERRESEIIQKNDELLKSNDELKAQLEKAQDEAAKLKREFDDYVSKYKVSLRSKAKGLELPRLEAAQQVFEAVVVREVTPKDVSFSHAGGAARVPLAKLTPDLQRRFLYDPEEVKAIETEEAAVAEAIKELPEVEAAKALQDPTRRVNPIALRNLTNRITWREAEIKRVENEAFQVRKSSYAGSNIGQYRLGQLSMRAERMRDDIMLLRKMIERELNGPESAGGPPPR